jgi:hypothetical protein
MSLSKVSKVFYSPYQHSDVQRVFKGFGGSGQRSRLLIRLARVMRNNERYM